jgi:hypothetical protein
MPSGTPDKSLENWIWDAACSIRGAKDAGKYKEYILPLIFTKRLCDVFDDELNRIAEEVGGRANAFKVVKHDNKLVRFYLPLEPKTPDDSVWSVIRTISDKIGERLTIGGSDRVFGQYCRVSCSPRGRNVFHQTRKPGSSRLGRRPSEPFAI